MIPTVGVVEKMHESYCNEHGKFGAPKYISQCPISPPREISAYTRRRFIRIENSNKLKYAT